MKWALDPMVPWEDVRMVKDWSDDFNEDALKCDLSPDLKMDPYTSSMVLDKTKKKVSIYACWINL